MGVSISVVTDTARKKSFGSIPHGGELISRMVQGDRANHLMQESQSLPVLNLSTRQLSDVEMIARGGYSPLIGFMTERDYRPVVDDMRLANGMPWSIPITLATNDKHSWRPKDRVTLATEGRPIAILDIEDVFSRDAKHEAISVYRTPDEAHPGVAAIYQEGGSLLGGSIEVFGDLPAPPFPDQYLPPAETRRIFAERGWRTIVGFQTRNPVHRAHEYLQKCALEMVDGLLLHPLVGETKSDDVPAAIRMRSYEVLIEKYYPAGRVLLAVNPAAMRYGGPREAVFHALIRKNYGCTHFIVGRDHAGVGNYYGPYDAQHIFSEFSAEELGIQPLFFENSFFCNACGNMATEKTCPHESSDRVTLSGTQVREMLRAGELPPPQFSRPEVASILSEGMRSGA
jgi:sulfate adenylyltransferase